MYVSLLHLHKYNILYIVKDSSTTIISNLKLTCKVNPLVANCSRHMAVHCNSVSLTIIKYHSIGFTIYKIKHQKAKYVFHIVSLRTHESLSF